MKKHSILSALLVSVTFSLALMSCNPSPATSSGSSSRTTAGSSSRSTAGPSSGTTAGSSSRSTAGPSSSTTAGSSSRTSGAMYGSLGDGWGGTVNALPDADFPDAPMPAVVLASDAPVYVEPLCWWTGMHMPLQLMVRGEGLGSCDVRIEGNKAVRVVDIHRSESPNILFVDVEIGSKAKPGIVDLIFSREGQEVARSPYVLHARVEGSRDRGSFTTADMIYLIMPDRFANGDPTNDTVEGMREAADRSNSFGRHGGDLQGIIDHLDYLEQLGTTAIWCTPLTVDNERRPSFHGYACSDYAHIDPRYGTNELFRDYVTQCHVHGIKVITDFVPNHCGTSHWWMGDLPFNDWVHQFPRYTRTNVCFSTNMDPNASSADLMLQESGWFDRSMADMNLDNPFVLRYFQQLAIWWVEWSGLDGIRIDTYPYIEKNPGAALCKAVTDEYPAMNIVGECWTESVAQLAYWQGGAANADGFDSHLPSIMDFPLRSAIIKGIAEDRPGWGEGMTRIYDALSHDFAYHDLTHMMIFGANHDTPRLGDIVGGDVERMKMVTALLATMRGIPQTYYGDELMFQATPDAGGDSAWRGDFPGGWADDTVSLFTPVGREPWQNDLFDYNCRLWQWRKSCPTIHNGRTLHFLTRDNTYAFFRYTEAADKTTNKAANKAANKTANKTANKAANASNANQDAPAALTGAVFVFANNNAEPRRIPWSSYAEFTPRLTALTAAADPATSATGTDIITGAPVTLDATTEVPPHTVLIVQF